MLTSVKSKDENMEPVNSIIFFTFEFFSGLFYNLCFMRSGENFGKVYFPTKECRNGVETGAGCGAKEDLCEGD